MGTTTMATTVQEKGHGALVKRTVLVLLVAALMAAMVALATGPAVAKESAPSCENGQSKARDNQPTNSNRFSNHNFKVIGCANDIHPGP